MFQVRKSNDRGHADHGWLNSYHTFSAGYRDPAHMGFRALRVMNEDRVAPGQGFGAHPHDNMEIISYVLAGQLAHRDSLGNGSVLTPGRFQRMSAGTGVTHSEFNPSADEPVHFYQIWLTPNQRNVAPSYQELDAPHDEKHNRLRVVASPDGVEGSLSLHQDARIYLADLDAGVELVHMIARERHVWLQVLRGSVVAHGEQLDAGDAIAMSAELRLAVQAEGAAEIMVFDLA